MVLKVADFGLAVNLREERAVTRVGTLDYMAPEVLRCPLKRNPGDNKDNLAVAYQQSVDAWAVGILAFELLTGRWAAGAMRQPLAEMEPITHLLLRALLGNMTSGGMCVYACMYCIYVCLFVCLLVSAKLLYTGAGLSSIVELCRMREHATDAVCWNGLHCRAPFTSSGASDAVVEAAIKAAAPFFPRRLSEPAKDFIASALNKVPDKRPNILQMIQHPWIRSFQVRWLFAVQ